MGKQRGVHGQITLLASTLLPPPYLCLSHVNKKGPHASLRDVCSWPLATCTSTIQYTVGT